MATDDVYKLTVSAQSSAGIAMNNYHFRMKTSGEPTEATFQQAAVDCKDIFRVNQSNSFTYIGWRAVQVRGSGVSYDARPCLITGGKLFESIFTSNTTGGNSGSFALPPQCAQVTTLRTGVVGRAYRGRIYSFGWSESDQTMGTIEPATMTLISTGWTTFLGKYGNTSPTDPNLQLVVWSHRIASGCVPHAETGKLVHRDDPRPLDAAAVVTAVTPRNTVFTQRRRVRGVGR
jgi:hypothetical protein